MRLQRSTDTTVRYSLHGGQRSIADWVRNLGGVRRTRLVARIHARTQELKNALGEKLGDREALSMALFLEYAAHVGVPAVELFTLLPDPRRTIAEALPALAVAEMVTLAEENAGTDEPSDSTGPRLRLTRDDDEAGSDLHAELA